jgi:hypothetical protein
LKSFIFIVLLSFNITISWSQGPNLADNSSSNDQLSNSTSNNRLNNRVSRVGAKLLSREGGWTGNGGGFGEISQNIWFIGKTEIPYCIESSADYPISKKDLSIYIQQSIQKWKSFFKKYNLLKNKLAGDFESERLNAIQFKDGKNRGLNFNFILKKSCQSSENGNNLIFLFGLENDVIKNYKKFSIEHPFGLAVRESYNHQTFAQQGIVWIDKFSKEAKEIKHILLHELGHVFGMEHNSVYVMDEKVAELLTKNRKFQSSFLGNIESDSWIYDLQEGRSVVLTSAKGRRIHRNRRMNRSIEEKLCVSDSYKSNKKLPRFIRKALNIPSRGCHEIILKLNKKAPDDFANYRANRLMRKSKSFSFTINLDNGHSQTIVGTFTRAEGRRPETKGPGVMTEALLNNGTRQKSLIHKFTLEKSHSKFPLIGNFKTNTGFIPAKISSTKGLVLELNIPSIGKWWTLKTSNNNF